MATSSEKDIEMLRQHFKINCLDSPAMQDLLARLRDERTESTEFFTCLETMGTLSAYEIAKGLETRTTRITTGTRVEYEH